MVKNVVTLRLQESCNRECGLRLSKARAGSALRSPCTTLVNATVKPVAVANARKVSAPEVDNQV